MGPYLRSMVQTAFKVKMIPKVALRALMSAIVELDWKTPW